MIARWRAAPASIKAWVLTSTALVLVAALPGLPDFEGSWLGPVFWLGLWSVLILRRSRVAWWIVVVFSGLGLFAVVVGLPADYGPTVGGALFGLLYVAGFVALLMPSARRWVRLTRTS